MEIKIAYSLNEDNGYNLLGRRANDGFKNPTLSIKEYRKRAAKI